VQLEDRHIIRSRSLLETATSPFGATAAWFGGVIFLFRTMLVYRNDGPLMSSGFERGPALFAVDQRLKHLFSCVCPPKATLQEPGFRPVLESDSLNTDKNETRCVSAPQKNERESTNRIV